MGTDYEPYTTLSYANGPGYNVTFVNGIRVNLSNIDTSTVIMIYDTSTLFIF